MRSARGFVTRPGVPVAVAVGGAYSCSGIRGLFVCVCVFVRFICASSVVVKVDAWFIFLAFWAAVYIHVIVLSAFLVWIGSIVCLVLGAILVLIGRIVCVVVGASSSRSGASSASSSAPSLS